jgi:hypothetical protein
MLTFAQAFPPGARLLPVNIASGPVKAWATTARDGHTRVVLINKSLQTDVSVQLQLSSSSGPVAVERLMAPSASATSGVTLGGQGFGTSSTSGQLAAPDDEQVSPRSGTYSIGLPAASAAVITQ